VSITRILRLTVNICHTRTVLASYPARAITSSNFGIGESWNNHYYMRVAAVLHARSAVRTLRTRPYRTTRIAYLDTYVRGTGVYKSPTVIPRSIQ
jgi:hypothetical protein